MRSSGATLVVLLALAACERAEIEPPRTLPEITLTTPADGQGVAFDQPFHLRATAIAPEGTLTAVDVLLRGAIDEVRRIEVSGAEAQIDEMITVPGDGHLGPDSDPARGGGHARGASRRLPAHGEAARGAGGRRRWDRPDD